MIHRDLVERCKEGDRQAQYLLYKNYAKAMYNICFRMVKNPEEAEDLLQDGFVYAFQRLESFRYESSFGAWLKRIMINLCINHLKKRKIDFDYNTDINHKEQTDETIDYEDEHLKLELVKKAITRLPEGYRVIFTLYLLEGYDHSEIADVLNISESTSKSQYHRAKKKIQETLKELSHA